MPSINVAQLPVDIVARSANVFALYEGKLYNIEFAVDAIRIIDYASKTASKVATGLPSSYTNLVRLCDVKYPTKSTVVARIVYITSGYVRIARCEVDLVEKTATCNDEVVHNLSWISAWEEIAHSTVIPPYLWIAPDKENPYIHYVDLDNGTDESFNTGLQDFAEPAPKFSHLHDDIYMMCGVHVSGASVRVLKLYSKSIISTGKSCGGGSPRAQIGAPTIFCNDVIFPIGGGGVAGSDNDILLFDHRFNYLGTIDLTSLTGWSNVDTMPGFTIVAKKKDGNYYALLAVRKSTGTSSPEGRLYWLEIDRSGNVISSQLLHTFDMDDGDRFAVQIKAEYSDATAVPLIDLVNKKIYTAAWTVVNNTSKGWAVEIDISDVWDQIDEFNRALWFATQTAVKVPTILTLSVTPL